MFFWTGFASGCLASVASSAFHGGTSFDAKGNAIAGSGWAGAGKFADNTVGLLTFGTVSGGAGAALTGGNFWQGAVTGLVVSGLGHMGSRMGSEEVDYADADKSSGSATNDAQGDVLNWFNESDGGLYKVAQSDTGVPAGTVRIYAHGNEKLIVGPDGKSIKTSERFDEVLTERSPTWRNYKANGGSIKIELMSCNTGNGFAGMLSKSFWNSTFIAPNNYYVAARSGAWGKVAGQGRWLTFSAGINLPLTFNNLNYRK